MFLSNYKAHSCPLALNSIPAGLSERVTSAPVHVNVNVTMTAALRECTRSRAGVPARELVVSV